MRLTLLPHPSASVGDQAGPSPTTTGGGGGGLERSTTGAVVAVWGCWSTALLERTNAVGLGVVGHTVAVRIRVDGIGDSIARGIGHHLVGALDRPVIAGGLVCNSVMVVGIAGGSV